MSFAEIAFVSRVTVKFINGDFICQKGSLSSSFYRDLTCSKEEPIIDVRVDKRPNCWVIVISFVSKTVPINVIWRDLICVKKRLSNSFMVIWFVQKGPYQIHLWRFDLSKRVPIKFIHVDLIYPKGSLSMRFVNKGGPITEWLWFNLLKKGSISMSFIDVSFITE